MALDWRNINSDIKKIREFSLSYSHPNFFIVGGMRCGTTSLWSYLRQHPEIYMPQFKEPIFFCTSHKSKQCIRDYRAYLDLFSSVTTQKAVGEASAAYLTSPESAELIYSAYPDAKIIISLRNPVEQVFSVYQWMIREGWEWLSPFEKALNAEQGRIANNSFAESVLYKYVYFYSQFALYSEQIDRYFSFFSKNKVKIILFDDLKSDPIATIKSIYDFLGVNSSFVPEIKILNESIAPFSIYGQFILKNNVFFSSSVIRKKIKKILVRINLLLGKYRKNELKNSTKLKLLELYGEDIEKTGSIINRDLSAWLVA